MQIFDFFDEEAWVCTLSLLGSFTMILKSEICLLLFQSIYRKFVMMRQKNSHRIATSNKISIHTPCLQHNAICALKPRSIVFVNYINIIFLDLINIIYNLKWSNKTIHSFKIELREIFLNLYAFLFLLFNIILFAFFSLR